MMELISNIPFAPAIISVVLVIGLVVLGIKQLISGWPINRSNANKREGCPAPDCSQTVVESATKVEILEKNQGEIFSKVGKIATDVSFIRGKLSADD